MHHGNSNQLALLVVGLYKQKHEEILSSRYDEKLEYSRKERNTFSSYCTSLNGSLNIFLVLDSFLILEHQLLITDYTDKQAN